jgi:hypothetical protein
MLSCLISKSYMATTGNLLKKNNTCVIFSTSPLAPIGCGSDLENTQPEKTFTNGFKRFSSRPSPESPSVLVIYGTKYACPDLLKSNIPAKNHPDYVKFFGDSGNVDFMLNITVNNPVGDLGIQEIDKIIEQSSFN